MKRILIFLMAVLIVAVTYAQDDIVLKGQKAPDFTLKTEKGNLRLSDLKGKVVLINFFATWCGPCRQELPELQAKIWEKYKNNPNFSLLIVGRQHTLQEVNDFKLKYNYQMPFYADPDRSVYSLYAKQYIPRNYLLDKNGNVVYCSKDYTPEEFLELLNAIDTLMK